MQNDVLYNSVMKKIFIIEMTYGTPEGEDDPVSSITGFNMEPDEVLAPGNLPLIGFCIAKNTDYGVTDYENITTFYIMDDGSAAGLVTSNGLLIDADLTNNVWKIHEE